MRWLYYLLPTWFMAETIVQRLRDSFGFWFLWEIDAVALAVIALPALAQLCYDLWPARKSVPGKGLFPKYALEIGFLAQSVRESRRLGPYRLVRKREAELVFRRGTWFWGRRLRLRLIVGEGGTPPEQWILEWRTYQFLLSLPEADERDLYEALDCLRAALASEPPLTRYESLTRTEFPAELLPDRVLGELGDMFPGLRGDLAGMEMPALMTEDFDRRLDRLPVGYCVIGFWGHGVNSHAFYFFDVREDRRITIRLPYAGAYVDFEAARQRLAETMEGLRSVVPEALEACELVEIVMNMGTGFVRLSRSDGSVERADWTFSKAASLEAVVRGLL